MSQVVSETYLRLLCALGKADTIVMLATRSWAERKYHFSSCPCDSTGNRTQSVSLRGMPFAPFQTEGGK